MKESNPEQKKILLNAIRPYEVELSKSTGGKHILSQLNEIAGSSSSQPWSKAWFYFLEVWNVLYIDNILYYVEFILFLLINSIEFAKEIELGQELHKRGKCTPNCTSIGTWNAQCFHHHLFSFLKNSFVYSQYYIMVSCF